ncbi:30S ribosomal protein S20 [Lyticum sinuosum]|uniref:Small ribosomal subunit protein bS20 n=1 Tax=Lyticum sinuosum TaxID=1332059 RepID=A0AAE4VLW9_9RICK|nr:30S ribosomal protein S20 [Lyticum sinuosum]MDZ5760929.1 30S ribosomal protein S20 [Lyticum sinuosum]
MTKKAKKIKKGMSSAERAHKKSLINAERNKSIKSRFSTFIKKAIESISGGNASVALEHVRKAESEIRKAVTKGVLHKNTASRKVSRIVRMYKKLENVA